MQEERTAGPHSYLAGYIILAIAAVLGIVVVVVASVKNFWGDRPMEGCEVRIERLAERLHQEYRAKDGALPDGLKGQFEPDLIRCALCRDDEMGTAVFRYRKVSKDTFDLECRYEAHRMIGGLFPNERFRVSLTEDLTRVPKETETPAQE
jgi:hypothetical protein